MLCLGLTFSIYLMYTPSYSSCLCMLVDVALQMGKEKKDKHLDPIPDEPKKMSKAEKQAYKVDMAAKATEKAVARRARPF